MIGNLYAIDFKKLDFNEKYKIVYKINEIIEEVNRQRKEIEELKLKNK